VFRAGEIIRARKEDLARAMTREMGKVLAEARGDVQEGIDMAYLAGRRGTPHVRRHHAERDAEQVGDVGALAGGRGGRDHAWNFPFAIPRGS
jgi:aldehyde dehydrogenase (NAD+)